MPCRPSAANLQRNSPTKQRPLPLPRIQSKAAPASQRPRKQPCLNIQDKDVPSSFCPLPWSHINIRNNGFLALCDHSRASKTKGLLKDDKGRPLHIRNTSFEQAMNSATHKAVRKKTLAGLWPEECARCRKEHESGMQSRNFYERTRLAKMREPEARLDFAKAKALTRRDGGLSLKTFPLSSLAVYLGNACNLKCLMCSPEAARQWSGDHYKLFRTAPSDPLDSFENRSRPLKSAGGKGLDNLYRFDFTKSEKTEALEAPPGRGLREGKPTKSGNGSGKIRDIRSNGASRKGDYRWFRSAAFHKKAEGAVEALRYIQISGGEPLLDKSHYNFLQQSVACGAASKTTVQYTSNLTVLPPAALKLWSRFKKVVIGVSIDGKGAVNDLIRFPSRASVIEKNLQKLDLEAERQEGRLEGCIVTTVSALNVFHLPELIEEILKKNYKHINPWKAQAVISPHPLHKPRFLHMSILEEEFQEKIRRRFAFYKKKWAIPETDWRAVCGESRGGKERGWEEKIRGASRILDDYMSFMQCGKNSFSREELIRQRALFIYFMDRLDDLRGTSWPEVLPELYQATSKWRSLPPPKFFKQSAIQTGNYTDRV